MDEFPLRPVVRIARGALVAAALAYLLVAAALFSMQRSLQYFPENSGVSPSEAGLAGVDAVTLATPDGERIVAWHAKPSRGRPTILFFQGNGGEIGGRTERFAFYQSRGYGFLAVSYRGYGGSTGEPTEEGLMIDASTAYDWLRGQGAAPGGIAVVGESLGTGVAVQLAAAKPVAAVALEAPYASTADIAAAQYWFLPVRLLMLDQFRSIDHIANVHSPLLISHGDADTLIPLAEGKRLFAAANQPKELAVVPGKGHELLHQEETWARELDFFDRAAGR